ncbi:T9SS type A sorting domain-containing protein [Winogradskyella sp. 3972H.M.0a.05]|uniref:T9SS type A sorting domain-containing protein n=1 Tax=Winogradskyella sp. 3972H.M.0a.05 TaxID=2950277 RepID=UPI00339791EA
MKSLLHYSILYLCFCFSISTWSFQKFQDASSLEFKTTDKTIEPNYTRNGVKIDDSGNLVYTDNTGIDDDISIVIDGTNYRLSNSSTRLTSGKGTKQDGNEVLVPIHLVTGKIVINTKGGDDTFTVDLSNGNIKIPIQYNGGEQNTASGDDMVLIGGDTIYDTVEHTFINNNDGFVDISGNSTINYIGLEPITDNLNGANRVFTFTGDFGNTEFITLDSAGTLDNQIDSDYGESVDFNNPTNSLTINITGAGKDLLDVRGLDSGFNAHLTINGETDDDVRFVSATDLGNGNLNVTCDVLSFSSSFTTTGSITTSSKNVTRINSGSIVQSTGQNVSITAGTELVPGDFGTILMDNGHVQTSGAGNIALNGTAYSNNNISFTLNGVYMRQGSSVTSDAGNINITGNGIDNGRANFRGVRLESNASIQSTSGDIILNGTGRNTANDSNIGVSINSGSIQGTTGPADIVVIGTGYKGVQIDSGTLTTTNPGDILIQGTSAVTDASAINVTSTGALVQSANILTLTANIGPINTPNGAAPQAIFDAANTTVNGVLAPGQSPGQVEVNGNINIGSGDTLEVEFESPLAVGEDYDQLKVNGAVNINGTTLNFIDSASAVLNGEYVIIDNDGADLISGIFNGLPEGASISGNGRTWNIHYNYNGSNDVVLIPNVPDVNVIVDGLGNLIFVDPFNVNDDLTIVVDGSNYRISDSIRALVAGPGATQDGNDVLVSIASVTGNININTEDGNDSLDIDFDGGNFTANAFNFDGGNGSDNITLSGTNLQNTVAHTFISATSNSEGTIAITGNSTISYSGLEGIITDNLNTDNRAITFNEIISGGTLELNSSPTALAYRLETSTLDWIDFNPSSNTNQNLSIETGNPVSVNYIQSGTNADFSIANGPHNAASLNNTIDINTAMDLGSGNLVLLSRTLNINQSITTSGSITTSTRGKTTLFDSNLESTVGNINMSGGTSAPIDRGINLRSTSEIRTTSGNIVLNGIGALNIGTNTMGILIQDSSGVYSQTGIITIDGTASSNDAQSYGVFITSTSTVQSVGGDISITGLSTTQFNNNSPRQVGVLIAGTASIQNSNSGNVTITGTGGKSQALALGENHGVITHGGILISAENGNLNITGKGTDEHSDGIQFGGTITTTGTGNIILEGEAINDSTNNIAINAVPSSPIISGGDIVMTGITQPIKTAGGIPTQALFVANNTIINGTLAPGQSPGLMIVDGNFAMSTGDVLSIELNNFSTAGTDYDQVKVTGNVDITGATLELIDTSGPFPAGDTDIIIIDNDGTDPITGDFSTSSILGNGKTWYIYTNGGDGNDVVLSSRAPNVYIDSGNLVFEDPINANDNLTITVDGTNYRISDSARTVIAGLGTTQDGNDVLVPITSVTGDINIGTGNGNDALNIDLNGGDFSNRINYDGGNNNDILTLSGSGTYENAFYSFYNNTQNNAISLTGNPITYTGLESAVLDQLNINSRAFIVNEGSEAILLNNSPTALEYRIGTATEDWVDFNYGNNGIAIATENSVSVDYFGIGVDGDFLIVNGPHDAASLNNTIDINVAMDLGNGDLDLLSRTLNIYQSITTTGSITTSTRGKTAINDCTLESTTGDINISSGTNAPQDRGIHLRLGSEIRTTSGNITLNGKGTFTTGFNTMGILLENTSGVYSQTGNITLDGTAGADDGESYGVYMTHASTVQSIGGNIVITGLSNTTYNEYSGTHIGIYMGGTANVQTTGNGNVTMTGTGGQSETLGGNYGVIAHGGTLISTVDGNVNITGIGTHIGGFNNDGMQVRGFILTTGTGNVILDGTAVNSPSNSNTSINVAPSAQITSGGDLVMTATTRPIKTPAGAASQTQFVANNTIINGTLAPGQSPGQIIVDGNFAMSTGDVLSIEINDFTSAGFDYDQVKVNGAVDITNTTLELVDNSGPLPEGDIDIIIIDNDGTDPINGTFNGLPNGTAIAGNSKTWYIYYTGDVVLSSRQWDVFVDVAGNMVFEDASSLNDDLTLIVDGANYRISDASRFLSAGLGTIQDGDDVLVPIVSVTGDININTGTGNDNLNIDLTGGDFTDILNYDAGSDTDGISFVGTGTYNGVTHTINSAGEGSVDISGNSDITYTGLEQAIVDNLDVNDRVFKLNISDFTLFEPTGSLENRVSASGVFTIDYNNPNSSLTLEGEGQTQGSTRIDGFATGFDADLTITKLEDVIRFGTTGGSGTDTDIGTGDFNITARVVLVRSEITTQGSVTITSSETTFVGEGDIISSADGDITINAGTSPAPGTGFSGLEIGVSTIQTTGSGTITLNGTAYLEDTFAFVTGVQFQEVNIISETGDININGVGATTGSDSNRGINMATSTVIQSQGGNINIAGTGGNSIGENNKGILMFDGASIQTSGSGNISINGTGGVGTDTNYGLDIRTNAVVSAENGDISIIGISTDDTGSNQFGIISVGVVSTTGTGNISITGTSSAANYSSIFLPSSTSQFNAGGNLTVTANTGSINTPFGVTNQTQFSAVNTIINGTLAPGLSPGQVTVDGNFEINTGDTLDIEVSGFDTPGTDFDQIVVNGTVNIEGATLNIIDTSGSFSSPENLILIDNDGTDPVVGEFNGLPNGSAISGNGKTWYIYYNLAGSNDVQLSTSAPNVRIDGSGNLVFLDPFQFDDNLTIIVDGTNYRISDSVKPVIAGPGTTQDGNEVTAPIASVTGIIFINTQNGNDNLNIDLSGGNFTDELFYGGDTGNNSMSISGPGTYTNVEHTFTDTHTGTIQMTGNSQISYDDLNQHIIDNLDVNNRTFNMGKDFYMALSAGGLLDNQIDVFTSTKVYYNNPNSSLNINNTNTDNAKSIVIQGLATGFDADMTITATESDFVRFDTNTTNIGNGNFNLDTGNFTIDSDGGLVTTGLITTTTKSTTTIAGTVQSNGGSITMTAGTEVVSGSGGIYMTNGHVETTGPGDIILDGTIYINIPVGITVDGFWMAQNSSVVSDTGNIIIRGNGVENGNVNYRGVRIEGTSSIQSNGGDIDIFGIGRSQPDLTNIGVWTTSNTTIQTGGIGTINVEGIGHVGSELNGEISTLGSGDISLEGTSGAINAPAIDFVSPTTEVTTGGNLSLTSNVGPINTPEGITVQTQFSVATTTIDGYLAPGQSPGQLRINSDIEMGSGDTLEIEVDDFTTAGIDYDQIVVNGIVNINGATLNILDTSGILSEDTETLVLIDNDGTDPVVGTFTGLPNGATIAGNGKTWYIYYDQGDGNDVVLSSDLIAVYTYNNGWFPSDPSGVSTSANDIVIEAGDASITANTDCKVITVKPGAGLTVNTGVILNTAGGMTLESISTSYSSLILDGFISGNIEYKRHVNNAANSGTVTGNNDLISPPLSGQNFGAFRAANPNLLSGTIGGSPAFLFGPFNNTTGAYETYDASDDASALTAGIGYRTGSTDNSTFTFTGTAENGIVSVPVDASATSDWYLIGNPYPSYMKVQDFLNDLVNSGLIDETATGLYGYDGAASDGWTIYNLLTTDASTVIAPGQGFFVQAEATGNIAFTPSMRTTGNSDDFILGRSGNTSEHLRLGISSDDDNYTTDFYFNENASLGLDPGYDAAIWGGTAPAFAVYSHLVEDNAGIPMAIQALHSDDLYNNVVIPLGVNANAGEQLSFEILETTFPGTVNVYLEDTLTNTITLLTTGAYIITPNQDIDGTGRFYLRFEEDALSTVENELETLNIYANHTEDTIVISGLLSEGTNFKLYDIQGRMVLDTELQTQTMVQSIDVSMFNDGVYVVELKNNNRRKTQKLILR